MNTFFDSIHKAYAEILDESWINSDGISDKEVARYQKFAYAKVNSAVSYVYIRSSLTTERLTWSITLDILQEAELLIATWMLLQKEYGINANQRFATEDGSDKESRGMKLLSDIAKWEIVLLDKDNIEFKRQGGEVSWPVVSSVSSYERKFSPDFKM